MKNLFSVLAMAGMLLVTSCTQEDWLNGSSSSDDYVDATFTIGTEDGIGTRAGETYIGDGTKVDKVACTVYNADDVELKELYQNVDVRNKQATYSVRLAKGQSYRVAFFAYNEAANAYNVEDLKNVIVLDTQNSNVEERDAFTAYYDVTADKTMTSLKETVTLTRPFAQLNLGIDAEELEAARKSGIVVKKSKIEVTDVYTAFNAFNNEVVGEVANRTFDLNNVPTETLKVDVNGDGKDEEYTYLALNYLLVGNQSTTDVKFTWESENGYTNSPVTEFSFIPVQRNYRTNLIGKLLTSPATFDIVIDAEFNKPVGDINFAPVFSASDLQAAIDAAPAGETTTIYLGADIEEDVVVYSDKDIVIDGCNFKYDGTITVKQGATVTIENVAFESNYEVVNFIEITNEVQLYTRSGEESAAVVTIKNCSFDGATAAAIVANEGEVIVEESEISGCVNGVVCDGAKKATVKNTTIATSGDGICFDGSVEGFVLTVEGNDITANQPIVVCNLTGNGAIALSGENTLTTEAEYQIVLTNGACNEKVMPTGTYTLTGAEGYTVYDGYVRVASWDEFTAALAANAEGIKLTGDVVNETAASYTINQNVIIDLNGKTFELTTVSAILYTGIKNNTNKPNVTIKNGYINNIVYGLSGDLNLTDIKFDGTIAYVGAAQGVITTKYANLLAERCDMSGVEASAANSRPRAVSTEQRSSGYLKFIDCNFPSASDGTGTWVAKKLLRTYINPLTGSTELVIKNCKFGVAANIELGATYSLSNMDITGCSGGFTFILARKKETLTAEDKLFFQTVKSNNSGTIRLDAGGETNVSYK